jgi:FtsH-binding integral membrane protein
MKDEFTMGQKQEKKKQKNPPLTESFKRSLLLLFTGVAVSLVSSFFVPLAYHARNIGEVIGGVIAFVGIISSMDLEEGKERYFFLIASIIGVLFVVGIAVVAAYTRQSDPTSLVLAGVAGFMILALRFVNQ